MFAFEVATLPRPRIAGFFPRISSHLEMSAPGQSQNKSIVSGRKVRADSVFPIERNLHALSGANVEEIKEHNIRSEKPGIARIRRPRIKTRIVWRPFKSVGA